MESKCKYHGRGDAPISTHSLREQANCEEENCPERGDYFKCYLENCRTYKTIKN